MSSFASGASPASKAISLRVMTRETPSSIEKGLKVYKSSRRGIISVVLEGSRKKDI
jgi:hypothetical protein